MRRCPQCDCEASCKEASCKDLCKPHATSLLARGQETLDEQEIIVPRAKPLVGICAKSHATSPLAQGQETLGEQAAGVHNVNPSLGTCEKPHATSLLAQGQETLGEQKTARFSHCFFQSHLKCKSRWSPQFTIHSNKIRRPWAKGSPLPNTKTARLGGFCSQVEMAGIEPASERIDPRISTSVVGLFNLA